MGELLNWWSYVWVELSWTVGGNDFKITKQEVGSQYSKVELRIVTAVVLAWEN